ncbi:MAG: urease accessory protein UreE [Paracoccus sp.]|nr:urease accessory protein UreE [Paracoccus sp. (in: a-proteobacteria)]
MNAPLALPRATAVLRATPADDRVVLDYEGRFLRRKRLISAAGISFLADLAETVSLDPGDALRLEDGRLIGVAAALEPCLRVTGPLPRLAWHIGNRHTPCQIAADHLLIRADHVLEGMLRGLGATVTPTMAAFAPEGGAYGHGRTMGHDHGHFHG